MSQRLTRRSILQRGAALAAAASCYPVPALLADAHPNSKLRIAAIGCGGRGLFTSPVQINDPDVQLVALVDVDETTLGKAFGKVQAAAEKAKNKTYDAAKVARFGDYRQLFDRFHTQFDAVLVATPDHQHACPTLTAMRLGKHVYTEKPLVHHISEARALGEAARQYPVVTQMGNQGSGTGNHQTLAEWLAAGAIGKLQEVHAWHAFANRFGGSMPQPQEVPVPKGLDWDAWLGPAATRPFATEYRPWHGWHDFGTGSLGGWGPHMMDAVCFALKLGYPQRVELLEVDDVSEDRFPRYSTVRYDFPQRGDLPAISVHWHEGNKPNTPPSGTTPDPKAAKTRPNRPPQIEALEKANGEKLRAAGSLWIGDQGMIVCGSHGAAPILYPLARRREFTPPEKTLPRPAPAAS